MNLNRAELNTVYDALTQAMIDVQEDIDSGLYIDEPDDLKDAKAYIERMDTLQARIHAELFPEEQT